LYTTNKKLQRAMGKKKRHIACGSEIKGQVRRIKQEYLDSVHSLGKTK